MPISIIKTWNPDLNYWELHPMMKTFKVFNDFHNEDKSKKKLKSSKIMWAIAFSVDPHEDNIWRNVNPVDRNLLISDEYLNNPKFDWEDPGIILLQDTYLDLGITIAEREVYRIEKKMSERGMFIETTPYSLDKLDESGKLVKGTADQLDRILAATGKVWEILAKAKATVSLENAKTRLRGDQVESATDEGSI